MSVTLLPQSTLGAIATLLVAQFDEAVIEPLTTPEAQAFSSWLHGAYLTIMLHVDQDPIDPCLLFKRIYTLLDRGEAVLCNTRTTSVAATAERLFTDLSVFETSPQLSSKELFSLAARLSLGPLTRQLLAWVDLAYGDAPRSYADLTYFAVRADGSLYQDGMPTLTRVSEAQLTVRWRNQPAFWRIITLLSKNMPATLDTAEMLLCNVVSASALPLAPQNGRALLFPNHIALLHNVHLLFGRSTTTDAVYQMNSRNETLTARLLQPWEGWRIRGAREAEQWLHDLVEPTSDSDAEIVPTARLYRQVMSRSAARPVLANRVINALSPNVFASLEAIDPDAQPEDDVEPETDVDKPSDTDEATDPDSTEPDADDTTPNADDATPDAAIEDPTNPQPDQNNSIGDISLEQSGDPGQAYLYRRAVLSLDATLARDPNIDVRQDIRQTLHLWCRDWLWLASVTQTQQLIKDLGLQKALEPVAKKD